jgi:hypothetical protein
MQVADIDGEHEQQSHACFADLGLKKNWISMSTWALIFKAHELGEDQNDYSEHHCVPPIYGSMLSP